MAYNTKKKQKAYDTKRSKDPKRMKDCKTYARKYKDNLKSIVLTHYGPNHTLGCCWEGCTIIDIDMLTLDHVNNDGYKHKTKSGYKVTSKTLYFWARENSYPDNLQTLCANHQLKKRLENLKG